MSENKSKAVRSGDEGYRPRGQRGYQPQSNTPINPANIKPPTGGSSVQPPRDNGNSSSRQSR